MAKSMNELYPFLPKEEIDGFQVTIWTYNIHVTTARVYKVTYEYHVNTPYPDGIGEPFYHQWCVRIDDNKRYEGRLTEGWDRIQSINRPMFISRSNAKYALIEELNKMIESHQKTIQELDDTILEIRSIADYE